MPSSCFSHFWRLPSKNTTPSNPKRTTPRTSWSTWVHKLHANHNIPGFCGDIAPAGWHEVGGGHILPAWSTCQLGRRGFALTTTSPAFAEALPPSICNRKHELHANHNVPGFCGDIACAGWHKVGGGHVHPDGIRPG
eukprot:jgi/Bigna1/125763/aug1.1_g471